MSPITTHILDTARGAPARGLTAVLESQSGNRWKEVGAGVTDSDGRIPDLLAEGALRPGVYRLTFETGAYFRSLSTAGFYPRVHVVFEIKDPAQHYHVPLLLSPYGYSTYRGS